MSLGLVGHKIGMTRIFQEDGSSVAVTVLKFDANRITQIKTPETDGYSAVQVTAGSTHTGRLTKAEAGKFAAVGVEPGEGLWEFRVADTNGYELGQFLNVDLFESNQYVDVSAVTKGKGFQGGVKRHNFRTQDATHGNSLSHRAPGSIGQNQTPGRVFKGKKMAGHMGHEMQTTQNLKIVRVDVGQGLILVKGAVPGPRTALVKLTAAVKG